LSKPSLDPIALEIYWNRLITIADEVDHALVRTSFSTIVGETRDFACIILDRQGRSLAQSPFSSPAFTCMLPNTTKAMLKEFPITELQEGDVLLTNDPWIGSGHLPDFNIVMPAFHNGNLVGFFGTAAHVADIGGRLDFFDARDVFEEGLRIPPTKLYSAGKPNTDVIRILRANVRVPDEVLGDVHAIIGAQQIGIRRVQEFLAEYGMANLDELAEEILDRSEQAMRDAIAQLPDGTYEHEISGDGYKDPVNIKIRIEIKESKIHVDFTGSSPQFRDASINCVLNCTYADTLYPIKSSLLPHLPNNEGLFRPISIHAPKGSVFNTTFPSPVKSRSKTTFNLNTAIYGALARAIPGKVQAGSGSFWALTATGMDEEGNPFSMHFLPNGGKGALSDMDGLATIAFPYNGTATPTEILENSAPLIMWKKSLLSGSGGAGAHIGGMGQEIVLTSVSKRPVVMSLRPDKRRFPPPGLLGGEHGRAGSFLINGQPAPVAPTTFYEGDTLAIHLPGGGGFGNPLDRDPAQVQVDVLDGKITAESAEETYGVVLDPATSNLKREATELLRTQRKGTVPCEVNPRANPS
jgi:N-methylhydantoinase B